MIRKRIADDAERVRVLEEGNKVEFLPREPPAVAGTGKGRKSVSRGMALHYVGSGMGALMVLHRGDTRRADSAGDSGGVRDGQGGSRSDAQRACDFYL